MNTKTYCWVLGMAVAFISQLGVQRLGAVLQSDEDMDGMGDFWENVYGAEGLVPEGDEDGDGSTNLEESIAGTDPFAAGSVLRITGTEVEDDVGIVRWRSKVGHFYWVQSSLVAGWVDETPALPGNGGEMVEAFPQSDLDEREFRLDARGSGVAPKLPEDDTSLLATHDSDGDGQTDYAEFMAGTDPVDPASLLAVTSVTPGKALRVQVTSMEGKWYQCERKFPRPDANWEPLGDPFPGADGVTEKVVPLEITHRVYVRVRAVDRDTDGDRATDWEERVAGSDPYVARSVFGFEDDSEWIATYGESPVRVEIDEEILVANATTGRPARVRISREGGLMAMSVGLIFSGEAVAGVNYEPLPSQIQIPAGVHEVFLDIVPIDDGEEEITEKSVVIELDAGNYETNAETGLAEIRVVEDSMISVMDFGAVGDGVADDTVAVQAALDRLGSDPTLNRLHFPVGTYRLNTWRFDSLTWNNRRRIIRLDGGALNDRDIRLTGDEGAVLLSTVSPIRSHLLEVVTRFRTLSVEGLSFEKDPVPLRELQAIYEPNLADGVSVILYDDRTVESVSFDNCRFTNCHGAVHVYGDGYDVRGKLARFDVTDCEVLNPYGANTVNSQVAFGGGQQIKVTPWVGRATFRGNLFDGGSDDMTDESTSPGGKMKDGGQFGSPLELVFEGNVVRHMGVEALFQINDSTYMGQTDDAFEIPPADGSTVDVTLLPSRSTFQLGDLINIRSTLRPGQAPLNNLFRVEAIDEAERVISLSNSGHEGNGPPGTVIPAVRVMYKDTEFPPGVAEISGNVFEGGIPPGSTAFSTVGGIVVQARSNIHHNLITGYSRSIFVDKEHHTPLHPGGHSCRITNNVILTRPGGEAETVTTVGILTFGIDDYIADNLVMTPRSQYVNGLTLRSKNSMAVRNTVVAAEIIGNGYNSPIRSVGFACGNVGQMLEFRGNTSRGFDVGVGPEQANQYIPHVVIDHTSVLDELPLDPRALLTEWP